MSSPPASAGIVTRRASAATSVRHLSSSSTIAEEDIVISDMYPSREDDAEVLVHSVSDEEYSPTGDRNRYYQTQRRKQLEADEHIKFVLSQAGREVQGKIKQQLAISDLASTLFQENLILKKEKSSILYLTRDLQIAISSKCIGACTLTVTAVKSQVGPIIGALAGSTLTVLFFFYGKAGLIYGCAGIVVLIFGFLSLSGVMW